MGLQFPATLRGVAIDWFVDADLQELSTWADVRKEFIAEFRLLRDGNEIVLEIYITKQGKNETICVYTRSLKELVGKMESLPTDGLKKRWFVEGVRSVVKDKMKIVPPTSYADVYNGAMDLESEQNKARSTNPRTQTIHLPKVATTMKNQVRKFECCRRICYG